MSYSVFALRSVPFTLYTSAVVEKCALLVSAYRKDIRCVHYHMAGWGFLQPHKQRGSVFCDYLFNFPLGLRQMQLRPLSSRFQSR